MDAIVDAVMDVSKDKGIPRVPVTDADLELVIASNEVLRQAATQLHYHADEVDKDKRQRVILARALNAAGIDPLDERAVKSYQARERRFANRFWWKIGAVAVAVAVFENVLCAELGVASAGDLYAYILYILGGLFVFGAAMGAAFIRKSWFRWMSRSLTGYSRPVPEFALAYALAIHRANADIGFQIEELAREDIVADPFLVACYGEARAYIAVWDEPKFEGVARARG